MLPVSIAGAAYSLALPAAASAQLSKPDLGVYFMADRIVRAVLAAADPVYSLVYPRIVALFGPSGRAALWYAARWAALGSVAGAALFLLVQIAWPALEPHLSARAGSIDVQQVHAVALVLAWLWPLLLGWKFIGYWMLGSGRHDAAYRALHRHRRHRRRRRRGNGRRRARRIGTGLDLDRRRAAGDRRRDRGDGREPAAAARGLRLPWASTCTTWPCSATPSTAASRFARTVGIGRQALFVDPPELERHRALRGLPPLREPAEAAGAPRYFEPLLQQWFGAGTVDSVDASAYEQASVLHDMNLPWRDGQPGIGSYDAVLDFGCLEHVFDFPVAWRNCVALCRVGGHLLHSLPANNLAGHGFYQFSPELFFNLYQAKNGFELRRPLAGAEGGSPALVAGRRSGRGAASRHLAQCARGLHAGAGAKAAPRSDRCRRRSSRTTPRASG